jgi:hypothetical protein
MKNDIGMVRKACENGLKKLSHYFVPGVRLTLIVRIPGKEEAEFVMSQDSLQDLSDALARGAARQQQQNGGRS